MTRVKHRTTGTNSTNAVAHATAFVARAVNATTAAAVTAAVSAAVTAAVSAAVTAAVSATIALALTAVPLTAQTVSTTERGAAALGSVLAGIGTTGRVLTVAAHPDDEDTPVIAWLARARHVETGYLSLTRGDGGQNLIGNELGEALGAIRTQELLSARRIDGGRQFFTRAYDFGFSKNAEETLEHWPKDSILGDVIKVVRAFRPHVMVGFFSGTPRDGHGHHQVSGILAREAFDLAADTVRFPVAQFGMPWTPLKFYRSARQNPDGATLRMNVGEYNPLLGRSYFEIAAESRSQHKSQGFGVLQRKGVIMAYLLREAARSGPADAAAETSVFDGVDTTWSRLRMRAPAAARVALDSATRAMALAQQRYQAADPAPIVEPLANALRLLRTARDASGRQPPVLISPRAGVAPRLLNFGGVGAATPDATPDATAGASASARAQAGNAVVADAELWDALSLTIDRVEKALVLAAGVAVEATAPRATFPVREPTKTTVDDSLPVTVTVYNRGRALVQFLGASASQTAAMMSADASAPTEPTAARIAPDSAHTVTRFAVATRPTAPWWLQSGRNGRDWFLTPVDGRDEQTLEARTETVVRTALRIADVPVSVMAPVVNRFADPVKGDQQVPVMAVPGITIGLNSALEYIRADAPVERDVVVRIQSAYPTESRVVVSLSLPPGLTADSTERVRVLPPGMGAQVVFKVKGRVPPGRLQLGAVAMHEATAATRGAYVVSYDHITPQRLYATSGMFLSSVSVRLPVRARVGYIPGSGDLGMDALQQLDVAVERLDPAMIASTDLGRFSAIVVGPRAYESSEELVKQNGHLLEFARRGGTLVVQYGAQDMNRFPVTPFPLTWTRPAARVTREDAEVRVLEPTSPLLTTPNRIGADDWAGWQQERSTYMPSTIDARYTSVLAMNDPGEPENRGALLVTPLGKGKYVYVTLALFRQLPNGVPGAARILLNLIDGPPPAVPPKM